MNRYFIRTITLLLIACLIVDPVSASGIAGVPPPHDPARTVSSAVSAAAPFQEEALGAMAVFVLSTLSRVRANASVIHSIQTGTPAPSAAEIDRSDIQANRDDPSPLNELVLKTGTQVRVFRNFEDYIHAFPDASRSFKRALKKRWDHHAIFELHNEKLGYTSYVAIHRLTQIASLDARLNGQYRATGGTRIKAYNTPEDALLDAMELSHEMSDKTGGAKVPIGGSKSTIRITKPGVPLSDRDGTNAERNAILADYAQSIEVLGNSIDGGVFTGQDVNISEANAALMAENAPTSISPHSTWPLSHHTALPTALGVYDAIIATAHALKPDFPWTEDKPLQDVVIPLQGLGNVGGALLPLLLEAGAIVIGTDTVAKELKDYLNQDQIRAYGDHVRILRDAHGDKFVNLVQSFRQEIEPLGVLDASGNKLKGLVILSPCAGQLLNSKTIKAFARIGVNAVVGSANNILEDRERDSQDLEKRGILYVPDYIANAGGVMAVSGHLRKPEEKLPPDEAQAAEQIGRAVGLNTAELIADWKQRASEPRTLLQKWFGRRVTVQDIADQRAREFTASLKTAPLPGEEKATSLPFDLTKIYSAKELRAFGFPASLASKGHSYRVLADFTESLEDRSPANRSFSQSPEKWVKTLRMMAIQDTKHPAWGLSIALFDSETLEYAGVLYTNIFRDKEGSYYHNEFIFSSEVYKPYKKQGLMERAIVVLLNHGSVKRWRSGRLLSEDAANMYLRMTTNPQLKILHSYWPPDYYWEFGPAVKPKTYLPKDSRSDLKSSDKSSQGSPGAGSSTNIRQTGSGSAVDSYLSRFEQRFARIEDKFKFGRYPPLLSIRSDEEMGPDQRPAAAKPSVFEESAVKDSGADFGSRSDPKSQGMFLDADVPAANIVLQALENFQHSGSGSDPSEHAPTTTDQKTTVPGTEQNGRYFQHASGRVAQLPQAPEGSSVVSYRAEVDGQITTVYHLTDTSGSSFEVAPEIDNRLVSLSLTLDGVAHDLLNQNGAPVHLPWGAGRIHPDGFSLGGKDVKAEDLAKLQADGILHRDEHENFIHGISANRPWTVVQMGVDARGVFLTSFFMMDEAHLPTAAAAFGKSRTRVTYRLRNGKFEIEHEFENRDTRPLPSLFTPHLNFKVPDLTRARVQIDADSMLETGHDQLPILQPPIPVPARYDFRGSPKKLVPGHDGRYDIDIVLTDLSRDKHGKARAVLIRKDAGIRVVVDAGPEFTSTGLWVDPYKNPAKNHHPSVTLEPTQTPDAYRRIQRGITHPRVPWVQPGKSKRSSVEITIETLDPSLSMPTHSGEGFNPKLLSWIAWMLAADILWKAISLYAGARSGMSQQAGIGVSLLFGQEHSAILRRSPRRNPTGSAA